VLYWHLRALRWQPRGRLRSRSSKQFRPAPPASVTMSDHRLSTATRLPSKVTRACGGVMVGGDAQAPHLSSGEPACQSVKFREVVHSVRTGKADVASAGFLAGFKRHTGGGRSLLAVSSFFAGRAVGADRWHGRSMLRRRFGDISQMRQYVVRLPAVSPRQRTHDAA
jgi:hypothetical protein